MTDQQTVTEAITTLIELLASEGKTLTPKEQAQDSINAVKIMFLGPEAIAIIGKRLGF